MLISAKNLKHIHNAQAGHRYHRIRLGLLAAVLLGSLGLTAHAAPPENVIVNYDCTDWESSQAVGVEFCLASGEWIGVRDGDEGYCGGGTGADTRDADDNNIMCQSTGIDLVYLNGGCQDMGDYSSSGGESSSYLNLSWEETNTTVQWTDEGVCAPPVCGDGILNGEEACDDGNLTPYDGCSEICQLPPTRTPDELAFWTPLITFIVAAWLVIKLT